MQFDKRFIGAAIGTLAIALGSANAYAAEPKNDVDTKTQEQKLEDAHKRLEQAAREVAELSSSMATRHMPDNFVFLGHNPNRAMLGIGIGIGSANGKESDDGVDVMGVSPGGPAANAGLKAGDVIVELNGKSLKRDKEDSPREKLLNAMSKLSPGDEVTVRFLREGKSSIAKFKAEKLPEEMARREMRFRLSPDDLPHFDKDDFNGEFRRAFGGLMHDGAFGDMELVTLSPKLAQYFGTDKGLLVVRAPQGKDIKLEDGDVLLDIDGRVPSNPGHAFRILDSYQPGEKVTLNLFRQKKKLSLAINMPEREEHGPGVRRGRIYSVPPKPPVPPTTPGAPPV